MRRRQQLVGAPRLRAYFLSLTWAALLVLTLASSIASPTTYTGKVIKVVDGDTIDIFYRGKPLRALGNRHP
jgi:endonuclease YncB( thermonuclease family)